MTRKLTPGTKAYADQQGQQIRRHWLALGKVVEVKTICIVTSQESPDNKAFYSPRIVGGLEALR